MPTSGRTIAFDHKRLRIARESVGWTRHRLAEAVGVTPAAVSQYEKGIHQPSRLILAKMSLVLGMPKEFFIAGRPTLLAETGVAHFRSLRSTSLRDRRRALTYAVFAWELTILLEKQLKIPPVSFPQAVLPENASIDDLENLAAQCRQTMGIGSGPIPNVTRLLEKHGAVVVRIPVECQKVDAFSCVLEDRPIVVLNFDKDDKARSRHSAAHELGHLVAHEDVDPGSQIIERHANNFAAAFLMPADEIAPQLPSSLNWNQLIELKHHWGVSIASLLFRAKTLSILPEYTYRRAFTMLNSRKNLDGSTWRIKEPGDLGPSEQPILLRKCIELLDKLGITRDALANELCFPRSLLDQLVGDDLPTIQINLKDEDH